MSETHLGAAMAGGNPTDGLNDHDLYETPPAATLALVNWLGPALPALVWEIACGNHHITRVLRANGCKVFENDLIDRGDHVVSDYLASSAADAPFSPLAIITNPPWDQASAFIEHSLLIHRPRFMALLLKAQTRSRGQPTHCPYPSVSILEAEEIPPWIAPGSSGHPILSIAIRALKPSPVLSDALMQPARPCRVASYRGTRSKTR
jgi:hypothetical protein